MAEAVLGDGEPQGQPLGGAYLDPLVGGGFSTIAAYLVALVVLWIRPYGLLGMPDIERV